MTPLPETFLYREPWWLFRLIRYSPVFLSLQFCVHCILVHLRWHWLPSQWQVCLVTKSSSLLIRLNFVVLHVWERMFSLCSLSMHWYTNGLYVWLQFCPQSLVMLSCPISQLVREQLRLHIPSGKVQFSPSSSYHLEVCMIFQRSLDNWSGRSFPQSPKKMQDNISIICSW